MTATLVAACAPVEPLIIEPAQGTVAQRMMQSRRFATQDEERLLEIAADVLLDLGFQIDASDAVLGLVVASKQRSAIEVGQVIFSVAVAVLVGADIPYDAKQLLRASVTSHAREQSYVLRVTFQRVVWNNYGGISKMEPLEEPEMYDEFLARVEQAAQQEGITR